MGDSQPERVYNLIAGVYDLDEYRPPEAGTVRDEFNGNPEMVKLWNIIYEACDQLGNDGYGGKDERITAITESYEKMMRMVGILMFEYGRKLPPELVYDHSIAAYAKREREHHEKRVTAAWEEVCINHGISQDAPDVAALIKRYDALLAFAEAAAYSQGAVWGTSQNKR